jgi:hypothetical protein
MSQQPRFPVLLVCLLIALPAQVMLHELGQILAARLMGDAGATFLPTQRDLFGSLRIITAHYDGAALSGTGQVAVSLSGLLLTQSVALALLVGSAGWPRRARTYAAVVVGTFLLDVPLQGAWAVVSAVPPRPQVSGVDLADVMSVVHGETEMSVIGMKAGLLLLVAGYGFATGYVLRRRFGAPSWAA